MLLALRVLACSARQRYPCSHSSPPSTTSLWQEEVVAHNDTVVLRGPDT